MVSQNDRDYTPAELEKRQKDFIETVGSWEKQLELVSSMVARNCTKAEFALLCHIAKKYELDPLAGEIRAMKFKRKNKKTGEYEWAPAAIDISRDGYMSIAHRSTVFDGMVSGIKDEKRGIAYCKIWRRDMTHPFYVEAYYEDYADTRNPKWEKQGQWKMMLTKCVEHAALRKAFSIHGAHSASELGAFNQGEDIKYDEDPDIPTTDAEREPMPQTPGDPPQAEPAGDAGAPPGDPEPVPSVPPAQEHKKQVEPEAKKKIVKIPVKVDAYAGRDWTINPDYIKDVIGCVNSIIMESGRHACNEILAPYAITIATMHTIAETAARDLLHAYKIAYVDKEGTVTPIDESREKPKGPPDPAGEPDTPEAIAEEEDRVTAERELLIKTVIQKSNDLVVRDDPYLREYSEEKDYAATRLVQKLIEIDLVNMADMLTDSLLPIHKIRTLDEKLDNLADNKPAQGDK